MKKKIVYPIIALLGILLAGPAAYAQNASKILVIISPEKSQSDISLGQGIQVKEIGKQDKALFDERCIPAENVLAKELQKNNFQVITSTDLSSSGKLSEKDIAEASRGKFEKVRKAAVLNKANIILNGFIDSEVTSEQVLQMDLTKVVTTISYKVYGTASGDSLFIDTNTYTDVGKSAKALFSNTLNMMATEIAQKVTAKIPAVVADSEMKKIASLQSEFQEQKVAATTTAATGEGGDGTPQIVIINPPIGRGFSIAQTKRNVNMEGMVVDNTKAGIKYFKINDQPVTLDSSGGFTHGIELAPGENRFELAALSNNGKMVKKEITLTWADDKTPPNIVITQPEIARGFTTVVKSGDTLLAIEGNVKDDSEIQYINVNGEKIPIDKDGKFSAHVPLAGDETKITIVSADVFGNTSEKDFNVSKGQRGLIPTAAGAAGKTGVYKPVLWGLAVGVSDYSTSMMDLKYAANDATSLVDFMKKQKGELFSEVNFKVLLNDQVTRDSIIQNISTHLGKAGPDDVVFIFVAGHGIKHAQTGSYYFVPSDADNENIVAKGLRMSDFEEAVNILSKNVNKVIITMDTCHSGAMEIGMRAGVTSENLAETLKEASGLYILSASKGGEVSMEGDQYRIDGKGSGHGAFTYALITGMNGKANFDNDKYISLNELFQYVSKEVPQLTDGRQHPYLRVSGTDMPLILLKN